MKKNVCVVCVFLCILISSMLVACNNGVAPTNNQLSSENTLPIENESLYNSYVVDTANDGVLSSIDKDWWIYALQENSDAASEKTIYHEGKYIKVDYGFSTFPSYSKYMVDHYHSKDFNFTFRSSDGKLVGMQAMLFDDDYFQKEDVDNAYLSAREMAHAFAKKYVDLSQYHLQEYTSLRTKDDKEIALYTFSFIKYVDGHKTTDYFDIQITSKGDILEWKIGDTGEFDSVQRTAIDKTILKNSVEKKMYALYASKGEYSYCVKNQIMAYSPDGQLVVISQIEAEIKLNDGFSYSTGVVIATEVI